MANITEEIIVELRQENRYVVPGGADTAKNGDFNVEINKPIDIEEGDVVEISSVFVDDNSTALGLINVEEDVSGSIQAYQYLYDVHPSTHVTTAKQTALNIRGYQPAATAAQHPDGHHYFLTDITQTQPAHGGAANTFLCNTLSIRFDSYQCTRKEVAVYFKYEFPLGTRKTVGLQLKKKELAKIQQDAVIELNASNLKQLIETDGKEPGNASNFSFPFMFQSAQTGVAAPDNYRTQSPANDPSAATKIQIDRDSNVHSQDMVNSGISGVNLPAYTEEDPTRGWELVVEPRALSLVVREATFTVAKGKYDPDVLAQTINQQIVGVGDPSDNGNINGTAYDQNNLLTTTDRIYADGAGITANNPPYFIREDGAAVCQYTGDQTDADNTYWVGGSNFGVSYAGAGRFQFSNLHQSIYVTGANGSGRAVTVEQQPASGAKFHLANKCGGIVFKDLKPNGFWFGEGSAMGFSKSILAHPKTETLAFNVSDPVAHGGGGGAAVACQAEFFGAGAIETGVNTTCDLNSLQVLINKVSPDTAGGITDGAFYDKPGNTIDGIQQIVVNEIGIFGHSVMDGSSQANAFYKLEIDCGIRSDLRGANQSSGKIQGIIGRYFQGSTFTQSVGGEGSIPYIHKGPPIKLSHFGVRVLMPDGVTVAPLGEDNTVFLSVTKKK